MLDEPAGHASAPEPGRDVASWAGVLDVDPDSLSPGERRARLRDLARLAGQVEAAVSRCVGSVETNGDHRHDGARTASAWMANATGIDKYRCSRLTSMDRSLRRLGEVADAWAAGELSTDKVQTVIKAGRDVEGQLEADQTAIIRRISPLTAEATRRYMHNWREGALAKLGCSPDDPEPDDPRANQARIAETFDGHHDLHATFGPLIGKEVAGLITAEIDRCFREGHYRSDDGLTPRQRNADALLRLLRRGSINHTEAGEPKRAVTILVDLNRLLGLRARNVEELMNWPCQTNDGAPVPLRDVLAIMEDATLNTILGFYGLDGRFQPAGEITTNRHANPTQRRHLRVRDQGCAWPGCDAPATWCQAHHEPPWEHTHRTTTTELILLCRHHHKLRHQHGFELTLGQDGHPTITRPDGTTLPTPPPGHQLPPDPPQRQPTRHRRPPPDQLAS